MSVSEIDERSRELIKTRIINKMKEIKSFPQFVVETDIFAKLLHARFAR